MNIIKESHGRLLNALLPSPVSSGKELLSNNLLFVELLPADSPPQRSVDNGSAGINASKASPLVLGRVTIRSARLGSVDQLPGAVWLAKIIFMMSVSFNRPGPLWAKFCME